jgi:hypothetical protein
MVRSLESMSRQCAATLHYIVGRWGASDGALFAPPPTQLDNSPVPWLHDSMSWTVLAVVLRKLPHVQIPDSLFFNGNCRTLEFRSNSVIYYKEILFDKSFIVMISNTREKYMSLCKNKRTLKFCHVGCVPCGAGGGLMKGYAYGIPGAGTLAAGGTKCTAEPDGTLSVGGGAIGKAVAGTPADGSASGNEDVFEAGEGACARACSFALADIASDLARLPDLSPPA